MNRPRVLIIGIDSATLDLIDPWVTAGYLPNLGSLMAQGCSGRMISTIQPVTSTAWATFLTGVNAGKHGLYDFVTRRSGSYSLRVTNANDVASPTLLDLVSGHGRRVISVNVPYTFPPRPVNGVIVAGPFAPTVGPELVYPREFFDTLHRLCPGYFILPDYEANALDPLAAFAERLLEEVAQRERLCIHLMRTVPWDLCTVVFMAADEAQHSFWDCLSAAPGTRLAPYSGVIRAVYQAVDRAVGSLVAQCAGDTQTDTTIIVMSDHGAGNLRYLVNLNHWLAQQGFLSFRSGASQHSSLNRAHLIRTLAARYRRIIPGRLRAGIRAMIGARGFSRLKGEVESALMTSNVDWRSTKAYSVGSGGNLFLNLRGREPEGAVEAGAESERIRQELRHALMDLSDPITGAHIVRRVHLKEDLYEGTHLAEAPDLIIEWADYSYWGRGSYQPASAPIFQKEEHFDNSSQPLSGTHRLEGMYVVRGMDVPTGARGPDARLVDLLPTCLSLLRLPAPEGLDGEIMAAVTPGQIEAITHPADARPPQLPGGSETGYTPEEAERIARHLRDLGYL